MLMPISASARTTPSATTAKRIALLIIGSAVLSSGVEVRETTSASTAVRRSPMKRLSGKKRRPIQMA